VSKTRSTQGQRPSRSELRASLIWPVVISVAIWVAGLLIYIFAPGRFDALVSGLIAVGLVVYLLYYQRSQRLSPGERLGALLLAAPAVAGIAYGLVRGDALFAITGVSASLLLLSVQRFLTTPISYRMAATVSTGRLLIGSGGTTVFKRFVRNAQVSFGLVLRWCGARRISFAQQPVQQLCQQSPAT